MADITLDGLGKTFGPVVAVESLNLQIRTGSVTAFLGPNGAGKTTTMRMVLGLVRPTTGRALIGGLCYADLPSPRRTVGAVLGPDGFHVGRTGRDHLRVIARACAFPDRRVDDVLDLVELSDAARRRVGTYSLGMRQRLGLAAALLGDPEVLITDEPANGLDPEGIAWLRRFLRASADAGRTVLVSSHLLAEVARTADRIVVISEGRLRFDGDLTELAGPAGMHDADDLENAFLRLTAGAAS
ncbi:MAG: ATP-binding cassette domain-containing protein [Cellulomonas sp.]|uniref:ABC transporter ATP-binding protein n=1 Tax=Cellulomonas sp. TaxID=40001 RepID=UPI001818A67D|nr:ATP-binding cassette domain-containing protein [Cellulomonas sp.]NMM30982.1 ATP-binding cassette domain-containing protein [Cellulomonas sp.]